MTLALARSLARRGGADAFDAAMSYAAAFDPLRGYAPAAEAALRALVGGADPRATGRCRIPEGSFGNGGAMRAAPLGLAYRHAPRAALRRAVEAALLPTHVHPQGIDGAVMVAAAAAWLCRQPDARACGPGGLLAHVLEAVETEAARDKLRLIQGLLESQVGGARQHAARTAERRRSVAHAQGAAHERLARKRSCACGGWGVRSSSPAHGRAAAAAEARMA